MFGKWLAAVAAASPEGASFGLAGGAGVGVRTRPVRSRRRPAPTAESFYAPLAALELPAQTRFIAGFAHEEQSLAEQRQVLGTIEKLLGRPVDIASSCGLGRREATTARRTLQRTAETLRRMTPLLT